MAKQILILWTCNHCGAVARLREDLEHDNCAAPGTGSSKPHPGASITRDSWVKAETTTPGDHPTNEHRAAWAAEATASFAKASDMEDESDATKLRDLLCDLRHWADRQGVDWREAMTDADGFYRAEITEGRTA